MSRSHPESLNKGLVSADHHTSSTRGLHQAPRCFVQCLFKVVNGMLCMCRGYVIHITAIAA
jgi:hypothetical protein